MLRLRVPWELALPLLVMLTLIAFSRPPSVDACQALPGVQVCVQP